jgi:hypothetical protein
MADPLVMILFYTIAKVLEEAGERAAPWAPSLSGAFFG